MARACTDRLVEIAGQAVGDPCEQRLVTLADFEELARQMDEDKLPDDLEVIQP